MLGSTSRWWLRRLNSAALARPLGLAASGSERGGGSSPGLVAYQFRTNLSETGPQNAEKRLRKANLNRSPRIFSVCEDERTGAKIPEDAEPRGALFARIRACSWDSGPHRDRRTGIAVACGPSVSGTGTGRDACRGLEKVWLAEVPNERVAAASVQIVPPAPSYGRALDQPASN